MKMPDGGFRPAYNVQFATTTEGGVIVGVDVTNEGTDGGQMPPMLEQIEERFGAEAEHEMLVDGGFATVEAIDEAERNGTTVYAPVKKEKEQLDEGKDPYRARSRTRTRRRSWRARMGTDEAKTIYKQRASTAEWVNAQVRNHGLYGVRVRGRPKVLVVVLWYASRIITVECSNSDDTRPTTSCDPTRKRRTKTVQRAGEKPFTRRRKDQAKIEANPFAGKPTFQARKTTNAAQPRSERRQSVTDSCTRSPRKNDLSRSEKTTI